MIITLSINMPTTHFVYALDSMFQMPSLVWYYFLTHPSRNVWRDKMQPAMKRIIIDKKKIKQKLKKLGCLFAGKYFSIKVGYYDLYFSIRGNQSHNLYGMNTTQLIMTPDTALGRVSLNLCWKNTMRLRKNLMLIGENDRTSLTLVFCSCLGTIVKN